jgi:hypothetical protein
MMLATVVPEPLHVSMARADARRRFNDLAPVIPA